MRLKCVLGIHEWVVGLVTNGSGEIGEVPRCACVHCSKTRNQGHDWSEDCTACRYCDARREVKHNWNGCKCTFCAQTRDKQHDWRNDCERCLKCGAVRQQGHDWHGCQCVRCGKSRHELSGCRCERCGEIHHKHAALTCSNCGEDVPEIDVVKAALRASSKALEFWDIMLKAGFMSGGSTLIGTAVVGEFKGRKSTVIWEARREVADAIHTLRFVEEGASSISLVRAGVMQFK